MEDINLKLKIDDSDVKKATPSLKNLRKELKAIQDTMAGMEEGSDEFLAAANKAGTLKHQIDEIREATNGASADFGDMLGNVTKLGAAITGTFQIVQGSLNLLGVESEAVTESLKTMASMMSITQGLSSIDAGIKSLDKLRNSITSTTAAAKLLRAAMTPKAILALTAAITAIVYVFKKFKKEQEEQKKAFDEQIKATREASDAYNQDYANAIKNTVVQYQKLRTEYSKLGSQAEKQKWIKKNKDELDKLGLSINNVNTAENVFVTNSDNIIEGFKKRAAATAAENAAVKKYEEYFKKLAQVEKYYVKEGDVAFGETNNNDGNLIEGDDMRLHYTKKGAKQKNKELFDSEGLSEMKEAADKLIETSIEFDAASNKLLDTGSKTSKAVTEATTKTTEKEDDVLKKLKEKMELEIQELNLRKERGDADAQGIDYLSELNNIYGLYRQNLKDTGKSEEELKTALLDVDMAIAQTNNSIAAFNQEAGQTAFDEKIQNIDTALAQVNATFAESSQTKSDEILQLEQILSLEEERLRLMEEAGMTGTEAWYEQKAALAEYKKDLEATKKSTATMKDTFNNVGKIGSAAMNAIGNVLTDLASTQDQTSREGFETAKKMNIAAATMSMLSGLVDIWAGTFTTKTGPWDYALMAIQSAALIATSAINIDNIKKQTFDSAGSTSVSSASASTSGISQTITAPVQQVNDVQNAEIMGTIADQKVYVSETDLSRVNKKVNIQETENKY